MKKLISFILVALMLLAAVPFGVFANESAQAEGLPFGDVKATDWFYSAVDYSYTNGIFKGTNTAGTTFLFIITSGREVVKGCIWGRNPHKKP